MSTNVVNSGPYLRTSREFPQDDPKELARTLSKTYIDIANTVNQRTIGIFPINRPAVGGETWFVTSQKQNNLREVFQFSDSNLIITHNINFNGLTNFVRVWGEFFDGTYWQCLPYVDVVNVTNQINVKVSSTQIIITKGAGSPPSISNGLLVLEWLANP